MNARMYVMKWSYKGIDCMAFHLSNIADKEDKTKRLVTFLSIPYKNAE